MHDVDKWAFDSLRVLKEFVQGVVRSRSDTGIRSGPGGCKRISVPSRITGSGLRLPAF